MKNVYLIQLSPNVSFTYLPYAVSVVWSHAYNDEIIKNNYELKEIFFRHEPLEDIINRLENPAVFAFSIYHWCDDILLDIAKHVKEKWPECLIVAGGPDVTPKYLDLNLFDSLVIGEGEIAFKQLLLDHHHGNEIPEISPLGGTRMENLSDTPSPYLNGVLDKVVADNPEQVWETVFESNRGCPYLCTFCAWGPKSKNKIKMADIEIVKKEIEWLGNNPIKFVQISDLNFGIFKERDLEIITWMKEAHLKSKYKPTFRYSTQKGSLDSVLEIAGILEAAESNEAEYRNIALSFQSLNDETLKIIKRTNFKKEEVPMVLQKAKDNKFKATLELIIGLPLETLNTFKNGIDEMLAKSRTIQLITHPLTILNNTELAEPETVEKYQFKFANKNAIRKNLVISTTTMTSQDIYDAHVWAWLIRIFHGTLYTNDLAFELCSTYNVPHSTFYETLVINLKDFSTEYVDAFKRAEENVFDLFNADISNFDRFYDDEFWGDNYEDLWKVAVETYLELSENNKPSQAVLDKEPWWPEYYEERKGRGLNKFRIDNKNL